MKVQLPEGHTWFERCFQLSVCGALILLLGAGRRLLGEDGLRQPAGADQRPLEITLVSASEDRAGTWGVFQPGRGDDNGNGNAITNDWHWKAILRLDSSKSIQCIQIDEEGSNQIWTTANPAHWPLVVFYFEDQCNQKYGEILGPFEAGTHHLDLYGQVDNRKTYGTDLRITFTDQTTLTAKIPRSSVYIGLHE